ncbi:sensor histidine kinase [Catenulispora pinisilvae]|uniref:sensor histidine kinase n=1 Tax=Catenulispora pinisilvae TaxID=2705253 RepID=UPI00189270F0|nr:histidine kinase [Catenulispora pinisilvae]
MGFTGNDNMPRLARGLVFAVAAALVSVHFAKALGRIPADPAAGLTIVAACAAILALEFRPASWPRAVAQLACGFLAVVPGGASIGLLAVPVGAVFLQGLWVLLPPVLAAAAWVEAVRTDNVRDIVDMCITVLLGGMALYAVTTLAALAARVHGTRLTLTAAAVTTERLRIASGLDTDLSSGLTRIRELAAKADPNVLDVLLTDARATLAATRATAADLRSLSLAPESASARALLQSAGVEADVVTGHTEPLGPAGTVLATVLREAVTAVVRVGDARHCQIVTGEAGGQVMLRVASDGVRTAALGADVLDGLAQRVRASGGRLAAGLEADGRFAVEASVPATPASAMPVDAPELRRATALYYILLAAFCVRTLLYVPAALIAPAVLVLAILCALQVVYSVWEAKRHSEAALVLFAALTFAPMHAFGQNWIAALGLLTGSLLIALPLPLGVPVVAAALGVGGFVASADGTSAASAVLNALVTCLIVYGMLRLARLVRELQQAGDGLARAAVVGERLRAARDLHDLLGHGLTAILLKAELAVRLRDTDPSRCRAEIRDVERLAAQGEHELRALTGGPRDLSFGDELASAAAVLAAADVVVELEGDELPVPSAAGAVLGVVLREAVTNVLRHSAARHARIAVTMVEAAVRLEVENDGVADAAVAAVAVRGAGSTGSGVGGLTLRLAEHGGTLTAGPDDGWYVLCAEMPR